MTGDGEIERTPSRRTAVLDLLRGTDTPLGVTDVAERLAVHPNTVRFHLDALVAQGQVERTVEAPSGPGRPRTVYAARPGMDRGGARRYRLLARILLSRLASQGAGAREAAADAGRDWGRYLVEQVPPSRRPTAREAADRLTAMLGDLGFDPQPVRGRPGHPGGPDPDHPDPDPGHPDPGRAARARDGDGVHGEAGPPDRIRLRHCPFLELAEEYGAIVCPLHLGLMQGALAELRAPLAATRLEPFAEPDACVAHLAPAGAAPGPRP
ncbi:metalloregulator ArsR/SmtB family transcription factor [Streptomyces sp. HPF1205]|uniref:helix-turn-helix transcriptional regulator n=1 Tax=Streptomyces sp. HPF1205 TaxID=2873262 RepID=UPI001CEDC2C4|nr:helix-turn-helix domain-containing protein [Streptomyces sp. HPF1205]